MGTLRFQDITEFDAEDFFVFLDGGFIEDEEEGFPADLASHHEVTDGRGELLGVAPKILKRCVRDFDQLLVRQFAHVIAR